MSVPDFSLFETMRYVKGEGVVRLPLHLERLGHSARSLGFANTSNVEGVLEDYLATLDGSPESMWRVRLELAFDGAISITSAPFTLQGDDTVWRVGIAKTPVSSDDRLLRHKTTLRAVYEAARAEYASSDADEVLLLNERGELAEGTITNVFVGDGEERLLTPPLAAGCLDGVFRKSLLLAGRAAEQHLRPEDLAERPLYVGNSLRGLIRARLENFAG